MKPRPLVRARGWKLEDSLEHLVEEGVLTEVVGRLKSGKEADVYVVRYGGEIVAAKVYKDRAQRSFKNNAAYKEGRSVRNSRSQRAIDSGSKFGKAAEDCLLRTSAGCERRCAGDALERSRFSGDRITFVECAYARTANGRVLRSRVLRRPVSADRRVQ